MAELSLFFVKHKPTGHYLPEVGGYMGRGGSHVEPVPPDQSRPRAFRSKLSASRYLSAWLRGKFLRSSGYDSYYGEYYEHSRVEFVASRKREEMEIIERKVSLS